MSLAEQMAQAGVQPKKKTLAEQMRASGIKPTVPSQKTGLENKVLGPSSSLFSGVGKLVGGTILRGADVAVGLGKPGKELQKSVERGGEMQSRALQKARDLKASGDIEGSTRLLKSLQKQDPTITLEDIITEPSKSKPSQIAGEVGVAALETAPFTKGLGVGAKAIEEAGAVISKAKPIQQAVSAFGKAKQVAPRTVGAVKGATQASAYAAPFGAAEGLQQEDATFSSVAGSAFDYATNPLVLGLGGALGAIGGHISPEVRAKSKNRLKNAVDDLENSYESIAIGTKSSKNKLDRAKAKTAFRNQFGTEGTNPARTLSENGIIPKQVGSKLDTFDQANALRSKTKTLHKVNRDGIAEVGRQTGMHKLSDLEEVAVQLAKAQKYVDDGTSKGMIKEIRQEYADLRESAGDIVELIRIDDIKAARGRKVFDTSRPNLNSANELIRRTHQKYIESVSNQAGYDWVAQLNRLIGDRLDAATFLESLNGRVVKGGRLQKYVFQMLGSQMGSNPLGKILGALGGDAVANILISQSIAGPIKKRLLKKIQQEDPRAYTEAVKWLVKHKLHPDQVPQLPVGRAGTPEGNVVTKYPETKQLTQEEIIAQGKVPKGEQVQRPGQQLLPEQAGQGRQEAMITPFTEIEPQAPVGTNFGRAIEGVVEDVTPTKTATAVAEKPTKIGTAGKASVKSTLGVAGAAGAIALGVPVAKKAFESKKGKDEFRQYFTTGFGKESKDKLEAKLKAGNEQEVVAFVREQLEKIIKQTKGTQSQGYYRDQLKDFNKKYGN